MVSAASTASLLCAAAAPTSAEAALEAIGARAPAGDVARDEDAGGAAAQAPEGESAAGSSCCDGGPELASRAEAAVAARRERDETGRPLWLGSTGRGWSGTTSRRRRSRRRAYACTRENSNRSRGAGEGERIC